MYESGKREERERMKDETTKPSWDEYQDISKTLTQLLSKGYTKPMIKIVLEQLRLEQQPRWIPVSERLPEDLEPVNITWVNHNPESYYADIKDKPFTATGVYFNGQWYWWSTLCTDILAEYSHNYDDIIDDDIEIKAWMPLPEPYEAESEVDVNDR